MQTNTKNTELATVMQSFDGPRVSSLEDCESVLRACDQAEQVPNAVRCMVIAEVSRLHGGEESWVSWVMERCGGYTKSELHHKRKVGRLLLGKSRTQWHAQLMTLTQDKLLSLTRLPEHLVEKYLEKVAICKLTRDQVRASVNAWLAAGGNPGDRIETSAKGVQRKGTGSAGKVQGDFFDALAAAGENLDSLQAYHSRLRARECDAVQATHAAQAALVTLDALRERTDPAERPRILSAMRAEADDLEKLINEGTD